MACPALRHALPSCAVCCISLLNELCQHVQSQLTSKPQGEPWSDLCRSLCVCGIAILRLKQTPAIAEGAVYRF